MGEKTGSWGKWAVICKLFKPGEDLTQRILFLGKNERKENMPKPAHRGLI